MSDVLPPIPPPIPPLTGAPPIETDARDMEDAHAHALMAMRGRWILAALNASLEQMDTEVTHHRLPVNVKGMELKVQLCGAAAGAVTAAQLVATAERNVLIRSIQPVFDDIATRLKAIEDRESVLGELAKKMQALLDAMASPTREEFDAIMSAARPDVVARVTLLEDDPAAFTFKVGEMMKRAIGDGPPVVRKFVPLAPGETAPQTVVMPPEGMRWETDEELRARLKEFAPAEERRARPTAPPSSPETVQALTAKAPKADET